MYWYELWNSFRWKKDPEKQDLNVFQKKYYDDLKQRAETITAKENRRKRRKAKYHRERKGSFSEYDAYWYAAKYFEMNYSKTFEKQKTMSAKNSVVSPEGKRMSVVPLTKHENYRNGKYEKIVREALNGKAENTDFDFVVWKIYQKIPLNAFSPSEQKTLQKMYEFAKETTVCFRVVKRTDRRNVREERMTYALFCKWYAENKAQYSCNQRFFVPLFCDYCQKQSFAVAPQKADSLLRYDAYYECFTEKDRKDIGIANGNTCDFFDIMKDIRETSKKSSVKATFE